MTDHERRILAYLDQRGPTHRSRVVSELAREGTRIASNGGRPNGSNGAAPLIMASWCRRLIERGFVVQINRDHYYSHHEITASGRAALRAAPPREAIARAFAKIAEGQEPLGADFEAVWDANTERLHEP
jgi:hypothetical protein